MYSVEVDKTLIIIDTAIDAIKKYLPKMFDSSSLNQFVSAYMDFRNNVVNPEQKYKNIKSLSCIKNDALIYFQEGSGEAVVFFWGKLKEKGVTVKRVNKFEKILRKIKYLTGLSLIT